MKKVLFASVAVLALAGFSGFASAAEINVQVGAAATVQKSEKAVNQLAGSGNISIGSVGNSNATSTAANINNDLTQDVDTSGLQATTYGGELGVSLAKQVSQQVNQTAISVNGEGAVMGSNLNSTAANLNNDAQVTVKTH